MTIGIYQIRNTITGKRYVGASQNIEARWQQHRHAMRRRNHENSKLMSDWHTYGEDVFEFSILEVVEDADMLATREFDYISLMQQDGSVLYNRVNSVGVGLIPHGVLPADPVARVGLMLPLMDVARLKAIAAQWYPGERNALSRTIRRLIREEYERLMREEQGK